VAFVLIILIFVLNPTIFIQIALIVIIRPRTILFHHGAVLPNDHDALYNSKVERRLKNARLIRVVNIER
jgi:hypothetical protein